MRIKGDIFMNTSFNKVQDVMENYKSAIYEKDVERFLSSYSLIYIFMIVGKTGRASVFLNGSNR